MEATGSQLDNHRWRMAAALCCSLLLHSLLWLALISSPPLPFAIGPRMRFDLFWVATSPAPASAPYASPKQAISMAGTAPAERQPADDDDDEQPSPGGADKGDALQLRSIAAAGAEKVDVQQAIRPAAASDKGAAPATKENAAASRHHKRGGSVTAAHPAPVVGGSAEPLGRMALAAGERSLARSRPVATEGTPLAGEAPSNPAGDMAKAADPGVGSAPAPESTPVATATTTLPALSLPARHPVAADQGTTPVFPARPAALTQPKSAASPAAESGTVQKKRAGSQPAAASTSSIAPLPQPKETKETAAPATAQQTTVSRRTIAPAVGSAATPEARGSSIPSLNGDLKLVMAGAGKVRLSVSFREYPKGRRNKVQSRGETRRQEKVVPVIAQTGDGKREAVIETAREGVYLFMVETEDGAPASATCTVIFFENRTKARRAALGTRTVSGRTVLTRILMPDAILWEDDSAFTAILQDAESTTKFNTRTGLQWKEYHE